MKKIPQKKERQLMKCPQCDFSSQNKIFFNEHVLKAYACLPTCPFCYVGFNNFPSLRKHCAVTHKEVSKRKS